MNIRGIGEIEIEKVFHELPRSRDGLWQKGERGIKHILSPGGEGIEFLVYDDRTMVNIVTNHSMSTLYELSPIQYEQPAEAVLMDLDGTTVKSERFWIGIIQSTIRELLGDSQFMLEKEDEPYVSGYSVSEHLLYCIEKYTPDKNLQQAYKIYRDITSYELDEILHGRGKKGAFQPNEGLKDFLLELKERNIKIALVTSGLYEKAWPEIISVFQTIGLGDPEEFYDCIITAGYPLGRGTPGTLGELSPKPHPWLYAEAAEMGLHIEGQAKKHVIGIEDSGAGILALRLAGFPAIGLKDGNISESNMDILTYGKVEYLKDALQYL